MMRLLKSRAFWDGFADGYMIGARYLFVPWCIIMLNILAWKSLP